MLHSEELCHFKPFVPSQALLPASIMSVKEPSLHKKPSTYLIIYTETLYFLSLLYVSAIVLIDKLQYKCGIIIAFVVVWSPLLLVLITLLASVTSVGSKRLMNLWSIGFSSYELPPNVRYRSLCC